MKSMGIEEKVKILAFVGMPGSGKGTCTDYLAATYGWPVVHFGNMVYDEVQRRGLDNVKDEVAVREDMRAKEGAAVLAKHAARRAQEQLEKGAKVVVLDGLYSWSENKYLAQTFGESLIVIAVAAPKKVRYQRVLDRNDSHRHYTLEQLITREIAEIENIEKGGPIAYADYTLVNETNPKDLTDQLEKLLTKLHLT